MSKILFTVCMAASILALSWHQDYEQIFSSDIYDQSSLTDYNSDQEKLGLLYSKQKQTLKTKLFDNIDEMIRHNERKILELDYASNIQLLAYPVIFLGELPFFIAFFMAGNYGTKLVLEKEKLVYASERLEDRKHNIMEGVKWLPHSDLERAYVRKKNTININRQKIIERLLIQAYDSKINSSQMEFLDAVIFFPETIRCLSIDGDLANFRKGLTEAKVQLARQLKNLHVSDSHAQICQQLLIGIAKASMNYFQTKTQTQEAYYLRTLKNLEHYALQICKTLDRSYFIVDANSKPQLDDEYCYGIKQQKRGLFLEPFLAGNKERRIKNPLLIILNAEQWFKNEENLKFILKLLDKTSTSFYSVFVDADIDWSCLSIVCFGSVSSKDFNSALQSRLQSYDLTRELL